MKGTNLKFEPTQNWSYHLFRRPEGQPKSDNIPEGQRSMPINNLIFLDKISTYLFNNILTRNPAYR